jgi:hypothetical protein
MPIARFSKKFYDTFGDDLTSELVDYLNSVETSYRSELRDLFEAHFGRFDAKLDQRAAELRTEFEKQLGGLRVEFHRDLGAVKAELIKWNVAFWAPVVLALIGLYFKP